jgi:hypothetical protein
MFIQYIGFERSPPQKPAIVRSKDFSLTNPCALSGDPETGFMHLASTVNCDIHNRNPVSLLGKKAIALSVDPETGFLFGFSQLTLIPTVETRLFRGEKAIAPTKACDRS